MPAFLSILWDNPSFHYVAVGCAVLGVVGGCLGCFSVLRKQSLLGDALAHAALPGICVAFLITGSKSPGVILAGAMVSGLIGSLAVLGIVRGTRLKEDAALGIVLSVFFGVGAVLLSIINKMPDASKAGLDKFLFGSAASLVPDDIVVLSVLSAVVLAVVVLFYKEFKLATFDRDFAATAGLPVGALEVLLTALIVVVVVIGLQIVGVILMVAIIVTPAAAARQWTNSLGRMILISAGIGAVAAVLGAAVGSLREKTPTGPIIVLSATAFLIVSLALAPARGLLWSKLRLWRHRARVRRENALADLFRLTEKSADPGAAITAADAAASRGLSESGVTGTLRLLERGGFTACQAGRWRLTDAGRAEGGRIVRNHRLWELFLARRMDLAADHVHRDAEEMEHTLPPEVIAELEKMLESPAVDPHGKAIPNTGGAA